MPSSKSFSLLGLMCKVLYQTCQKLLICHGNFFIFIFNICIVIICYKFKVFQTSLSPLPSFPFRITPHVHPRYLSDSFLPGQATQQRLFCGKICCLNTLCGRKLVAGPLGSSLHSCYLSLSFFFFFWWVWFL